MTEYRVELMNPKGRVVMAQTYPTGHLAWCAGENWNMLAAGNSYQVVPTEVHVHTTSALPEAVRRAEEGEATR